MKKIIKKFFTTQCCIIIIATGNLLAQMEERFGVWMSEKIYSLLPSTKELWIVEGAEHGGGRGPLGNFTLLKRGFDFLEKNLK